MGQGDNHNKDMTTINLTKGKTSEIDEADVDLLSYRWYCFSGGRSTTPYAVRKVNGKMTFLHRVIMERAIGRHLLSCEVVDHIDGDGLNNRLSNLRVASRRQNSMNRRRGTNNTSGYVGVYWDKHSHKWRSDIHPNGKRVYIGRFDDPIDAAIAHDNVARQFYGEFARTNFENGAIIVRTKRIVLCPETIHESLEKIREDPEEFPISEEHPRFF